MLDIHLHGDNGHLSESTCAAPVGHSDRWRQLCDDIGGNAIEKSGPAERFNSFQIECLAHPITDGVVWPLASLALRQLQVERYTVDR